MEELNQKDYRDEIIKFCEENYHLTDYVDRTPDKGEISYEVYDVLNDEGDFAIRISIFKDIIRIGVYYTGSSLYNKERNNYDEFGIEKFINISECWKSFLILTVKNELGALAEKIMKLK